MITFRSKYKIIVDEQTLSDAVEWYATLKGATLYNVKQRAIFANSIGYLRVCAGGNYVDVHRLLMMYYLKRELNSNEDVHHKDNNKLNCALSNLELISHSEHTSRHCKRPDILDSMIIEMLTQGKRRCDIARYFGCSSQVIYYRVKRMQQPRVS